jgi:radical SAM superfamily enzyme YgiQ (UPF0313 family)
VVEELETIDEPYVLFVDDNTLGHVPNAFRLARLIEEHGIRKKYEVYSRADTIAKHGDLIETWRRVGMELILIGLEACDGDSLTAMRKRTSTDVNRKAIELCRSQGVEMVSYFIVRPDFDHEDFRRLSDYVERNGLTHPVFTVLSPFPGTDLYEQVKDTLTTDRLELYDFYHTVLPTKLPLDEFYDEFLGLYRKAYPTRRFLQGILRNRSVLSPRMIGMNLRFRKRMYALRGHHGEGVPGGGTGSSRPSGEGGLKDAVTLPQEVSV